MKLENRRLAMWLTKARKLPNYHISEAIDFDIVTSKRGRKRRIAYISEWSVYSKCGMTFDEYMSPENRPLLSSKEGDTLEDLITFVKKRR